MKNITLTAVALVGLCCAALISAYELHDASDLRLLQAACPQGWQNIDKALPYASNSPTPPTSVTWANTADKDDFMLFQREFIIKSIIKITKTELAIALSFISHLMSSQY